jgi:hypothetical protein
MKMLCRAFLFTLSLTTIASAHARVFDGEKQYETLYGADTNKKIQFTPPYKLAIYRHNRYVILALFDGLRSEGEFIMRSSGRLSETDVNGILSVNQGSSSWKKQKIDTSKDPNVTQLGLWMRGDGKLFALSGQSSGNPFLLIGTKRGGEILFKEKDKLVSLPNAAKG